MLTFVGDDAGGGAGAETGGEKVAEPDDDEPKSTGFLVLPLLKILPPISLPRPTFVNGGGSKLFLTLSRVETLVPLFSAEAF